MKLFKPLHISFEQFMKYKQKPRKPETLVLNTESDFLKNFYLFIYLAALGLSHHTRDLLY